MTVDKSIRLLLLIKKERLCKQQITQENAFHCPTVHQVWTGLRQMQTAAAHAGTKHALKEHGLKGRSRFHCYPCG